MNKNYGRLPVLLGKFDIDLNEVMYYLYLPISLAGSDEVKLPAQLRKIQPLIDAIKKDIGQRFTDEYIYVTIKRMYVGGGISPNRPGWHADGFMTDDLNYIWYDCLPTIFNGSDFKITQDHLKSLEEFETQAREDECIRFISTNLLKLDQYVVHRVNDPPEKSIMRTFIKISVSPNKYNLKDNSHNYELDYEWEMFDREAIRNDPTKAQKDRY